MKTKLQQILEKWPLGGVRTVSALKKDGYSQDLLNRYRYSGWLKAVGGGALAKSGDEPTLIGAIFALQHDLKLDVHIGALSALELKGKGHYVRGGQKNIWLFGSKKSLPRWFTNHDWKATVQYRSSHLLEKGQNEGLIEFREGNLKVLISDEIRAMLELLSIVPLEQSIEEAKDLMLGLSSVHPAKATALLKSCTSIKAKRLFLLLAEECGHAWMNKIDVKGIDLGSGPRSLTPGGRLNKKYNITVPASIFSEGER